MCTPKCAAVLLWRQLIYQSESKQRIVYCRGFLHKVHQMTLLSIFPNETICILRNLTTCQYFSNSGMLFIPFSTCFRKYAQQCKCHQQDWHLLYAKHIALFFMSLVSPAMLHLNMSFNIFFPSFFIFEYHFNLILVNNL
jgi:hypothetical protein